MLQIDLLEKWKKRDPLWEIKYEDSLLRKFCDYGLGTNQYSEVKAKTFGAAYEMIILAFFIGVYDNKDIPLTDDKSKTKKLGWAIENWGASTKGRGVKYDDIQTYMFIALLVRTKNIDNMLLDLDKGIIEADKVIGAMMDQMEAYINYGLHRFEDMLQEDPNCLYEEDAFFNIYYQYMVKFLQKRKKEGKL
jgi:hypothetical protein